MSTRDERSKWLTLLGEVEAKEAEREGATGGAGARHESEGWVGLERALKRMQVARDGSRPMGPFGAAPTHPSWTPPPTPPMRAYADPNGEMTPPATPPSRHPDVGPGLTEEEYDALTVPEARRVLGTMGRLVRHDNRFVREAVLGIIELVLRRGLPLREGWEGLGEVLQWVATALQDNWSQVRYRATHCADAYIEGYLREETDFERLLPRLCLNRYYIAEGVRVVTQRIWERVVGQRGVSLVQAHLPAFVDYYVAQSKEKNHAVREAALLCLSELVGKVPDVDGEVLRILAVIDAACDDCSWPVRDVACVCLGRIIAKYPDATAAEHDKCYARIRYQTLDPIPSVRRHAAEALADYARISDACWGRVMAEVSEMMKQIHSQPVTDVRATDLENVSQFGVAKRIHDNDVAKHTNAPMFSCGSLAPGPSTARVLNTHSHTGCSGGPGLPRTGLDPWYATDTAVYAVFFLSSRCTGRVDDVAALLPAIVPTLSVKTFIHYPSFWQSVWGRVPGIVQNLGKRKVTLWVGDLIPSLFDALACDNKLASVAAADCIRALRKTYGESVWASKLDARQAAAMQHPLLQGA